MKLSGDLSPFWIYVKGVLFLAIVIASSILLVFLDGRWERAGLVLTLVWSSSRLYYFMFYVIERYVDESYRFSGVYSFLKYLCGKLLAKKK